MPDIIFYADDDVNGRAIQIARDQGVEIVTSNEVGMGGAEDHQHFEYALVNNHVLVSANVKDFRPMFDEWLGAGNDHPGMILISGMHTRHFGAIAETLVFLHEAGTAEDLRNQIWWI